MNDVLVDRAPDRPASYLHDRVYLEASQILEPDERLCFVNADGDGSGDAVIPVVRRGLPDGRFDLRTPTGFPGPARPNAFVARWSDVARRLQALGCVSVYLQCRGEVTGHAWSRQERATVDMGRWRSVYTMDLTADFDAIRARCRRDTRQRLNKILREEHEVHDTPSPAFADAYGRLAARSGFSSLYTLDATRFSAMAVASHLRYTEVRAVGSARFIGGAFFGGRGEVADFVYSACDETWPNAARTVLLHVIKAARAAGYARLNLGGGIAEGDALAQFKASFGTVEERWSTVRAITDPEAAARLTGRAPDADWFAGYFPPYRRAA